MRDKSSVASVSLFEGLSSEAREQAAILLAARERLELEAGARAFASVFPRDALLLVEEGFVVLRATFAGASRSVVTCEAGPGRLLRPPSSEEELVGLTDARLIVVPTELRDRLLSIDALAERIVEQLGLTLAQNQEAIANFAALRHATRVRRKLLQLARSYGHVVRDGIRIDFPISHALLAEMVGSSRETVTRAIDQLQRSGFVARSGSTYRVLVSAELLFAAV